MALADAAAAPLPSKDMAVYRGTHKLFEHRQYKRGLKVCDQLLRKHPSHAETQAMRALFLAHIGGRREEAHTQARDALRAGVRSYVCWYVYGLVHRADRNYAETLKAFRSAARIEETAAPPGNPVVVRDIAALQTHLRLYPALVDTRQSLLAMRPALRMHWVALAVAYDLAGAHSAAAELLGVVRTHFSIEEHVSADVLASGLVLVEEAGLQMYRVDCLLRAGRLDEALVQLSADAFRCRKGSVHILPVDHASVLLLRGQTLLRRGLAGDAEAARALGMRLFEANSDSYDALRLVLATVPRDDAALRSSLVSDMRRAHPESLMLQTAALQNAQPSLLVPMLADMLGPFLERGVPSASSLLYDAERVFLSETGSLDPERLAAVDMYCARFAEQLEAGEGPLVAGHLLLGQHWSRRGEHGRAIAHHECALEHAGSDSAVRADVLLSYACALDSAALRGVYGAKDMRVLCTAAMRAADAVRDAQPADRYANSMSVRYALRAGHIVEAKTTAARFLRVRPSVSVSKNASSTGSADVKRNASNEESGSAAVEPSESGEAKDTDQEKNADDEKEDEDAEEIRRAPQPPRCIDTDASPAIEDQLRDFTDMQASWFLLELGAAQYDFQKSRIGTSVGTSGHSISDVSFGAAFLENGTSLSEATANVSTGPESRDGGTVDTAGPGEVCTPGGTLRAATHSFAAVLRYHADFVDDQFDFHNYALRRSTLSAYVSGLLRWEDNDVFASPAYYAAAVGYLVCRRALRDADIADGDAISALGLDDKAAPAHASAIDELAIVERLVTYHGARAASHALALDTWLRRGADVTARLVRSLCVCAGVFSDESTSVEGASLSANINSPPSNASPMQRTPHCFVRDIGSGRVSVHVAAEHICDASTGAVATRVLAPYPFEVDIASLRSRVDLNIGHSSVRSSLHRSLDAVCLASTAPLSEPTPQSAVKTPALDRILSH